MTFKPYTHKPWQPKAKKTRKPFDPSKRPVMLHQVIEEGRVVVWPIRLVSEANVSGSQDWRVRHRRAQEQRKAVALLVRELRKPTLPCVVTLTRIAPNMLDSDNVVSAPKRVRDALATWIGVDDRDPRVTWVVGQERAGVREYGVRVEIREVQDG